MQKRISRDLNSVVVYKKGQSIPKGQSKIDNPKKLVTWSTQDEEKPNENTTQYVLDNTIGKQTQFNEIHVIHHIPIPSKY